MSKKSPEKTCSAKDQKPVYLIAGGNFSNSEIAEDCRTVLAACEVEKPQIAYVGTANNNNIPFFKRTRELFLQAGAGKVEMVRVVDKSMDISAVQKLLEESDAIFLAGGDVEDGITGLKQNGLDRFLADLYRNGNKLFFGMSAGAIMMGTCWVRWGGEDDDSTATLFPCLNLVPLLFDTHGEEENWQELRCALHLLGAGSRGYGLSSGGFFSADSAGRFTSFRKSPAVFLNRAGKIEKESRKDQ